MVIFSKKKTNLEKLETEFKILQKDEDFFVKKKSNYITKNNIDCEGKYGIIGQGTYTEETMTEYNKCNKKNEPNQNKNREIYKETIKDIDNVLEQIKGRKKIIKNEINKIQEEQEQQKQPPTGGKRRTRRTRRRTNKKKKTKTRMKRRKTTKRKTNKRRRKR